MRRRIYLASSWRNGDQPQLIAWLREIGHDVYDFRNPPDGSSGFSWAEIDPEWEQWTPMQYRIALNHPIAVEGYSRDLAGMHWADTFLCLLPCGKSAHLEAGWACGRGIPTGFVYPSHQEPELMCKLGDQIIVRWEELIDWLSGLPDPPKSEIDTWEDYLSHILEATP